jgi:hypothetical protein
MTQRMTRVRFYGLPAWVGTIQGPTSCKWWNRDPAQINFDPTQQLTVDVAKTPAMALAGTIQASEIDVDDHTTSGGRTTIGPLWPSGAMIGASWVSDSYLSRCGIAASTPEGGDGHDYEYQMIHYFDGEQNNRRFYGFHAKLLQVQGNLSLIEIWNPGTGAGAGGSAGSWWLDLAAEADPGTPSLVLNQPAALFLTATAVGQTGLTGPKLPPYFGSFALAV